MPTGSPDIDYKVVKEECEECKGEGIKQSSLFQHFMGKKAVKCNRCNGKGFVSKYVRR